MFVVLTFGVWCLFLYLKLWLCVGLLLVGCLLTVTRYVLLGVCHCCSRFGVRCWLLISNGCVLFDVCYVLPVAFCSLCVVCCSLVDVCRLSVAGRCVVCVAVCGLFCCRMRFVGSLLILSLRFAACYLLLCCVIAARWVVFACFFCPLIVAC